MVATPDTAATITLDAFLTQPETKPASEYQNGLVTQKPMPKGKHSTLQFELAAAINQQAKPGKIAYALPELRCTFAGRSIVPDIAVLRWSNLPQDADGEISDQVSRPPDWIIEILSPDQSATPLIEKIIFCLHQGTELGWLIDPHAKSILVLDQGLPKVFSINDPTPLIILSGLDHWQIATSAIFAWLKL
jgi:Uma2 family endonuclease